MARGAKVTIDELEVEAPRALNRFWWIQSVKIVERTALTITLHFHINPTLFVQVYFSQRSGRLNLALIGNGGRLYGCDCEQGQWHRHPFLQPHQHEVIHEGMSPQPVMQFLTEVESMLVENDLV